MHFVQIFVNLKSEHIIFGSMCCLARFTFYLSAIAANYCASHTAQFITTKLLLPSIFRESHVDKSGVVRTKRKPATTATTTNGRWMLINNSKQLHYKCHQLRKIAKLMRIYDNIWSSISNTANRTSTSYSSWPRSKLLAFVVAAIIYIYIFYSVRIVHFVINASETRNTIDFLLRWKVNDRFNNDFYSLGSSVGFILDSNVFVAVLACGLHNIQHSRVWS